MRAFRFRLARVLRVRALEEEVALERWRAAELEAARSEALAAEAAAGLEGGRRDVAAQQAAGSLAAASLIARHRALDRLEQAAVLARTRAAGLRATADALAADWRDARANRRGLERLEARARASHREDAARAEMRELDETALRLDGERASRSAPHPADEIHAPSGALRGAPPPSNR